MVTIATHLDRAALRRHSLKVSRLTACLALALFATIPASAGIQANQGAGQSQATCNVATPVMAEFATLPAEASLEDHEGAVLFAISQLACANEAIISELEAMLLGDNLTKLQRQAVENVIASLRAGGGRGSGAIGSRGSSFFTAPLITGGGGSSNYSS
jgi:hypothetical protein